MAVASKATQSEADAQDKLSESNWSPPGSVWKI
jgi:hypothetical protein